MYLGGTWVSRGEIYWNRWVDGDCVLMGVWKMFWRWFEVWCGFGVM